MDDPNLKGFMSFASKQLHLNIPYFYLHKAGDDLSDLGPNVIPVCYGMEYSDLSNAVEDMANSVSYTHLGELCGRISC